MTDRLGRQRIDGVPPRRVVLLGASNLTRGISTVVETARGVWGRPLQVLAALGHGRSYGQESRALVRRLPGIVQCGLWDDLAHQPAVPTAALVTDIGNDLLYEAPVERVAQWVAQCFDQLLAAQARVVVTALPIDNLTRLSPRRFHFFRRLYVPRCSLTLETLVDRALRLNQRILESAAQRGIAIVAQQPSWYGLDPMHIKFARWPIAWRQIMAPWLESGEVPPTARMSIRRAVYLRALAPQRRHILGIEQRRRQPSGRFGDGTTIALY